MAIAFHDTLAFLTRGKPTVLSEVIEFFQSTMARQREEALCNYRERRLYWPRVVREAMENALAVRFYVFIQKHISSAEHHAEKTLVSRDGLLVGRPDEVLITENGCVIVDYKSGRSTEEKVDSYEAQVHFYAGLWQEMHGEMPVSGKIEFLLDNRQHNFSIDVRRVQSLVTEARSYASALKKSANWLFQCPSSTVIS